MSDIYVKIESVIKQFEQQKQKELEKAKLEIKNESQMIIDQKSDVIENLSAQIKGLTNQVDILKSQVDGLITENDGLRFSIEETKQCVKQRDEQLDKANQDNEALKVEIQKLREENIKECDK